MGQVENTKRYIDKKNLYNGFAATSCIFHSVLTRKKLKMNKYLWPRTLPLFVFFFLNSSLDSNEHKKYLIGSIVRKLYFVNTLGIYWCNSIKLI